MKKLIYCAAALATALFAGSCQKENFEQAAGGKTVTYTVQLPDVATKATGDGTNVTELIYEVWRTENPNDETLQEKTSEPKLSVFIQRLQLARATSSNSTLTSLTIRTIPSSSGLRYHRLKARNIITQATLGA